MIANRAKLVLQKAKNQHSAQSKTFAQDAASDWEM
jgi:hypothetical protein